MAGYNNNQFNYISSLWNYQDGEITPAQVPQISFRLFGVDIPLIAPMEGANGFDCETSPLDPPDQEVMVSSDYIWDDNAFEEYDILDADMFEAYEEIDWDNLSPEDIFLLQILTGADPSQSLNEEEVLEALDIRVFHLLDLGPTGCDDKCAICLDNYEEGQRVGKLQCQHEFHEGCITEWLFQRNQCPICRTTALNI